MKFIMIAEGFIVGIIKAEGFIMVRKWIVGVEGFIAGIII